MDRSKPWAYFDGSSQFGGQCGGEAILHLNEQHSFKLKSGLGQGSNNYAKLLSLKIIFIFSLEERVSEVASCCKFFGIPGWL